MADELLKALGRVQGAQQAERERLHAAGAAVDELLRPLDADEQASILDAVFGGGEARAGGEVVPLVGAAGGGAPVVPAAGCEAVPMGSAATKGGPLATSGEVVPLAPARRRWIAGAGSLAAAAALMLVLWRDDGADDPGLPLYSVVQAGGEASERGEPEAAKLLRLRGDTAIDWRLAPASAVDGEVGLRVVAHQGEVSRWVSVDGVTEVAASGVIRLRGRAGAWLGLPPGLWTLNLVIGRPDRLPATLDAYSAGVDRPREHGWQIERVQVQVED